MCAEADNSSVSRRVRSASIPTLRSNVVPKSPITISLIKSDDLAKSLSHRLATENAYATLVLLKEVSSFELWMHGRKDVVLRPAPSGGLFILHLQSDPVLRFRCPVELVRFYIPQHSLNAPVGQKARESCLSLSRPDFGTVDLTLLHLAFSILPALNNVAESNQLFVDYVAHAFYSHIRNTYEGPCRDLPYRHSGLSSRRARKVTELIDSKLDGNLSVAELASECCLSQSHFSRAFLQTFGMPPHKWLLERRIEKAKELVTSNRAPLAEIAISCGFVTQSHFSRVFVALTGSTPSSWRRQAACVDPSVYLESD